MSKNESTLSDVNNKNVTLGDRNSIPFNATYPLIEFTSDFIDVNEGKGKLTKYLINNFWFTKSNHIVREGMISRTVHINKHIQIVLDFLEKIYGSIGFEVRHISIAGSYIHSDSPGDIDLNVVVSGSFFDYTSFNEGIELLDKTGQARKISVILMGEDNISGKKRIPERVENEGFIHDDTIVREMLVAPMRNVTVYGMPFESADSIDAKNVLVRIARQLYFSQLTLEGKIKYYEDEPFRTKKALNRLREAQDIIEWLVGSNFKK